MTTPAETLPDLPESERGRNEAVLLAGSAGYLYFLQQLVPFISPPEAKETYHRFRFASRIFWLTIIAFLAMYVTVNQSLGPYSLRAVSCVNDLLRAALFVWSVMLVRRYRISIAAQLLLPIASLCFLPFAPKSEPVWIYQPLIFGAIVLALAAIGWCIDGPSLGQLDRAEIFPRVCLALAMVLWIALNLIAYFFIVDHPMFPVFSLAATFAALPFVPFGGKAASSADVDFLYAAAWKRWRFFVTGRLLAIMLGIAPFLMFSSLLDYQEQLESSLNEQKTPEILRVPHKLQPWHAYYWRQAGHFLNESDLAPAKETDDISADAHAIYYVGSTYWVSTDDPDLPERFRGDEYAPPTLPSGFDISKAQSQMLALNMRHMTRAEFFEAIRPFENLQIDSLGHLMRRDTYGGENEFIELSYRPVSGNAGVCFAGKMNLHSMAVEDIERRITGITFAKWIFFVVGVFGFIFLWRRGGDSSLARWLGIWLIGVSLVPVMDSTDDTMPHILHWFWQQSIMYHWNTPALSVQPFFNLLLAAGSMAAVLWLCQFSPAVCWTHLCWPTRIYPNYPPIVRRALMFSKVAAVVFCNSILMLSVAVVLGLLKIKGAEWEIMTYVTLSAVFFTVIGAILRVFTARYSEIQRLGILPLLTFIALNATLIFYVPVLMTFNAVEPYIVIFNGLGAFFACIFVVLMCYLILKKDFLRVRAIPGFTMLILLIAVPFAIHEAEDQIPAFLRTGPFFGERGAEMVSIMLVILLFPALHEWLHELLLMVSFPMLRRIEHRVEHALEKIVDAETDHDRTKMVSELLDELHVPEYLFLSRRPKGIFAVDINTLRPAVPPVILPAEIELSESLRHFLGQRRHFIDLHCMAFEWSFFFHQFELYRLKQKTGCRFLLPISVGESLRALLLLPDGPAESVFSNPAVSENINNLGIAAALSRRAR